MPIVMMVLVSSPVAFAQVEPGEEDQVLEPTVQTLESPVEGDLQEASPGVEPPEPALPTPFENTRQACEDGIDNDGDEMVDCSDSDCQSLVICSQRFTGENTAASCQDGTDNDGDGSVDCIDVECQDFVFCATPQATQPAPVQAAPTVSAEDVQLLQYRRQRMQLRQELHDRRLQYRLRSRLFITPLVQFWTTPMDDVGAVMSIGAGGALAYRKHFRARLGFHAMLGVAAGGYDITFSVDDEDESSSGDFEGNYVTLLLSAAPVFGPFGRFYLSPVFWFRQNWFSGDLSASYTDGTEMRYISVPRTTPGLGTGIDFGLFLGQRDMVDLGFQIHVGTMGIPDPRLYVMIGMSVGIGISFE